MKNKSVWSLIVIFSVVYSVFSVVRHLRLETDIFDLGYYDQLIWMYGQGKIYSSILEYHPWIDHFTPSLFLLVPLFWIWDSPLILLIFQAFFVSFAAYPIYVLGQKYLKNHNYAIVISFSYLAFFGILNAIAYDFHPIVLIAAAIPWITLFYERKNYLMFWTSLIIVMGLQENGLLITGAYGLFITLKYRDYKKGLLVSFISGLLLIFIIKIFIPSLGSQYYYYPSHLDNLNFIETTKLLYLPSSKLKVLLVSFGSFGFLPLGSVSLLPLFIEEFVGRFVGTLNPNRWVIGYHYDVTLAPIMALGSIYTLSKIKLGWRKYAVIAILIGTVFSSIYVKSDIKRIFNSDFYNLSFTQDTKDVLKLIPKDSSVAATNNLGAQIAHRENLIFLTNCIEDSSEWGEDGKRCFKLIPDYIVADFIKEDNSNDYYPDYSKQSLMNFVESKIESGEYKIVVKKGETILLKREPNS